MPYCPECGAEYRKEIIECPDCGVELVEDEEEELFPEDEEDEEREGPDEVEADDLIEIYSGPPYAANLVTNALKERGISAVVRPEAETPLIPPTEASVFVSESDYHENDDVIQECLELVEVEVDQGEMFNASPDQ